MVNPTKKKTRGDILKIKNKNKIIKSNSTTPLRLDKCNNTIKLCFRQEWFFPLRAINITILS